jgi:hypothetical protein
VSDRAGLLIKRENSRFSLRYQIPDTGFPDFFVVFLCSIASWHGLDAVSVCQGGLTGIGWRVAFGV